ncbi:MAG: hypothetical protein H7255_11785, partial [Ramlibacter sp.]|nr:hypothetical protein [Ramlibacter sp.]
MRALWLALVCCLAMCALGVGTAGAQVRVSEVQISDGASYPLSRAFSVLEDKDAKLTLDDILKPGAQAAFKPLQQSGPGANFGLTTSAIWLRVKLVTSVSAPTDWLIEVAYPPLDSIELYSSDGFGFEKQIGGDLQPFASRQYPHRN